MLARNLLPSPSPLLAPRTNPAMSTNSTVVGTCSSIDTTRRQASRQANQQAIRQAHTMRWMSAGHTCRKLPGSRWWDTALRTCTAGTQAHTTRLCTPARDCRVLPGWLQVLLPWFLKVLRNACSRPACIGNTPLCCCCFVGQLKKHLQ